MSLLAIGTLPTNAGQIAEMLWAVGFGAALGVYYDVFRVIRIVMQPSARVIFLHDLLYFASAAAATFLFTLAINGGYLRVYIFAGMAVGFGVYYVTVGKLVIRFTAAAAGFISRLWSAFWKLIFWPFRGIGRLLAPVLRKKAKKCGILAKKCPEFIKKVLQKPKRLLYNYVNKATENKDS